MRNGYILIIGTLLLLLWLIPPVYGQVKNVGTTSVVMATTSVDVTYPVNAKLFGVFPATLPAQALVESSGRVSLHYPWYAFLFSTNQAELQTKLQAVGKAVDVWDTSIFTEQQQRTLWQLLRAALQSNSPASSTASSSVQ